MSVEATAAAAPPQSDEKEMFFHILRDMSEGVLVLDATGAVLHLNEQGQTLLGEKQALVGRKYAAVFAQSIQGGNDAFHQFILDAVYDKEHSHSGEVDYTAPDGTKRRFLMTSSFLRGDDLQKPNGVMVVFSDITELARLQRQRRESSVVFAVLMICVCVYLFLWSLLRYLGIDLPGQVMTVVIEGISILMFFIILKTTSFSIRDIGLRITDPKATFVPDLIITAVGLAVLVAGKLVILRALGVLYHKQGNIWGLSIIHYVLGEAATFLRYLI